MDTNGEKWKINNILKICQEQNEHILIANVKSLTWHLHWTGLDNNWNKS